MRFSLPAIAVLIMSIVTASPALARDNQLSEQEKRDGWVLLFDGKSPGGWATAYRR